MAFSTACPDWEERIIDGRPLVPEPLYPNEAEYALKVFCALKMVDAPKVIDPKSGELRFQTMGEVSADWLLEFVRCLFGAYDHATCQQLINEAFLLISKKNGKSTDAAAIMLTALIINWRHNQELMILAPTLEVANNAFTPAKSMIEADAQLKELLHIQEHMKTIKHRVTGAVLKVIAADSATVSGSKAGFVFVDELWLFGMRHDADAMLREATGGLVSKPEGFVIYASTQSDREPAGVFKAKLQYARDVRDGVVQNSKFLPVLYEFPDDLIEAKAYLDAEWFYVTNPNLGRSVSKEWIESKLSEVINATGGELQVFLAKHLNVEIGQRLSHDRWRAADYWPDAIEPCLTLDELIRRSEVITGGLDGGGLDDLLGLVFIGRERAVIQIEVVDEDGNRETIDTHRWLVWAHAICNPIVLTRRQDIASRLQDFARAKELTIAEVNDDMAALKAFVKKVVGSGLLPEKKAISIDPNNISAIVDTLIEAGIDCGEDGQLHRQTQGSALVRAVNMIPRKLLDGSMVHSGSGLMAWCVGNTKVEKKGNHSMITKQVAGSAKIDPVIALLCAALVMSFGPVAKQKASYQLFFV